MKRKASNAALANGGGEPPALADRGPQEVAVANTGAGGRVPTLSAKSIPGFEDSLLAPRGEPTSSPPRPEGTSYEAVAAALDGARVPGDPLPSQVEKPMSKKERVGWGYT